MSTYNSNTSNTFKESAKTETARIHILTGLKMGFARRGFKYRVFQEVPATFADAKYHGDFGCIAYRDNYNDIYFFLIEIDGDVGHGSHTYRIKDADRDEAFLQKHGIRTIRIPLDKAWDISEYNEAYDLFNDYIWRGFYTTYIEANSDIAKYIQQVNKKYAYELADNCNGTQCTECPHGLDRHDLMGCDYRFVEDKKYLCNCHKPFLRSDT